MYYLIGLKEENSIKCLPNLLDISPVKVISFYFLTYSNPFRSKFLDGFYMLYCIKGQPYSSILCRLTCIHTMNKAEQNRGNRNKRYD